MSSVRMIINAAKERRRRVLSNIPRDQMLATWMLIHKRADIMDEPANQNKVPLGGLLLVVVPRDDGEVAVIPGP